MISWAKSKDFENKVAKRLLVPFQGFQSSFASIWPTLGVHQETFAVAAAKCQTFASVNEYVFRFPQENSPASGFEHPFAGRRFLPADSGQLSAALPDFRSPGTSRWIPGFICFPSLEFGSGSTVIHLRTSRLVVRRLFQNNPQCKRSVLD